jgi:hypothetical protein
MLRIINSFLILILLLSGCSSEKNVDKNSIIQDGNINSHSKPGEKTEINSEINSNEKPAADCSNIEIPNDREVNTNLNKQNGLLSAAWYDNTKGEDVTVTIRYTDDNCSESVKNLISHVLQGSDKSEFPSGKSGEQDNTDTVNRSERPKTKTDVIQIEGTDQEFTLYLYDNKALGFSTYIPEDMVVEAEHNSMNVNYTGEKNSNATLKIFANNTDTVEKMALLIKSDLISKGFKVKPSKNKNFGFSEREFHIESPFYGAVSVFKHNESIYGLIYYYSGEMGDGFHPRVMKIIDEIVWYDTINDYSFMYNNRNVPLLEWDDKININEILGEPLSEKTEVLGNGSDTLTGSFVKKIEYEGLKLTLFSPKQNGKTFWIFSIEITSPKYMTARGVKIGDNIDKLKQIYPDIDIAKDGRTDVNNCAYDITSDMYSFLRFEVKDGVIKEIKIYQDLS